ncbi:MAG: putative transcriptional regulator [bacterium]|nr:putative transcriptional regulator [bacterium]
MATVSRLTGFKPELLRAWESRHGLLAPSRGPGGQRLYTDNDMAILLGVRALIDQGRSISEIAALGRRQLIELAKGATQSAIAATTSAGREGIAGASLPGWPAGRLDGGALRAMQIAAKAVGRLSARLDPAQLLQLVVETLAVDFQAALARVWVAEPDGKILLLRASAGLSKQTTTSSRARIDLRTYRFKVGVVARSREPFISNRIVGDADFDQRWVHKERLASVAVLPLVADDVMCGVMAAFFRVALNEDVIGALRMFSAVAGGCLAAHDANAIRAQLSA